MQFEYAHQLTLRGVNKLLKNIFYIFLLFLLVNLLTIHTFTPN